ncbi:hypothetical protein KXD96_28235 (plasmid) [Mycobacterium sp. SMC-2]|uniref:hypothetical protein n=1 Tax=Mycobacterium sp. SMC-2 TaxID=2857058 RepID=UPI0021B3C3BA|nr:hypothetical protein [Mycobacterium sp. SMC-2]UXA06556.1 hypothetical protein KXD96_27710 [Mycobacterium sp. SMC-2]UXA09648.1 hypothetical protein KXD96_28235 [Mycobacterium sp. SMC-2]
MTELATRNDVPRELFASQQPAPWDGTLARVPAGQISKGERLREWLDLFIKTEQVANVLAKTTFVPKSMQGKPAEVAAAMMRSFEMAIDPLDGLGHMHVINGKVGYSAELMRRRIIEAGHEIKFVETTDSRAVIKGRRREHVDDESKWQTFTFTEENARKAKIDLGGYPADKLVARASSRMCRRMFPEVLAGASIAEDLIDAVVIEGGDMAALDELPEDMRPALPRAAGTTAQRRRQPRKVAATKAETKPAAAVVNDVDELLDDEPEPHSNEAGKADTAQADEPQQDDLLGDEAQAQPEPSADEGITKAQLQKLSILRQREGYADTDEGRADWFQWVNVNIGRLVGSNKDLSKAEAHVLIDVLETAQAQDAQQ